MFRHDVPSTVSRGGGGGEGGGGGGDGGGAGGANAVRPMLRKGMLKRVSAALRV
jgi:hypothetical protein